MTPKLPIKILRRFSPEKLDSVFQDILEYNIEDKMNPKTLTHTISFKAFAKLVIDDMFNFLEDEKFFPIEEENYNDQSCCQRIGNKRLLKPRILQYIHLAMGSSFWVEAVSGNARSTAQLQTATYIGYIFSVSLNMSVIV